MGSDIRFFADNRVELIAFAELPAAGAWSDIGETPSVGYNRATLIWEYDEGEQANGGAVDMMVYYSIYSQSADVPAGETEWIPFSAGTGDIVVSGSDTEILVQAARLHFQPTSGDREAVTVDMSWPSYVERIGVRVRESGDVNAPGSCRVAVQLSIEDGPSVPLLLNTTGTEGLTTVVATIANGQSLSDEVDIGIGRKVVGIIAPEAWTAAEMTFQVGITSGDLHELYDADSTNVQYGVVAGAYILPEHLSDFEGVRYIKVRSGTAAAPVNQAAERTIILVTAAR